MQYGEFAQYYDRMMHDVDYDRWAEYLDGLIRAFKTGDGATILDCACGTGSITLRLNLKGYEMIGADRSEEMLREAQTKARAAGCRIPFVRQDMKALAIHRPVDVVNCSCDGVNYLLGFEELRDFFRAANSCLKTEGLLLFDCSTEYKLKNILGNNFMAEDGEGYTYLWQNRYRPKARLLEMELIFFVLEGELYRRFDETHLQRAHRQGEITAALEDCGFEALAVYDAFTNAEPDEKAARIQFAARKRTDG
ncbi:MAG: class I SAM-dependent methyltransferase [Clostridia bacterium]|nr:class I SAM-dependent methyltransferase [Clostridia bacterium]